MVKNNKWINNFLLVLILLLFSGYASDVTSYDYDAPLSEAGDYTDKYQTTRELLQKYNTLKIRQPSPPASSDKIAFPSVNITEEKSLNSLLKIGENVESENVIPMELLPINNNNGQSYGYIVYRKTNINIPKNAILKIEGRVCDTIMVLINGELKSKVLSKPSDLNEFGYWKLKDSTLNLGNEEYDNATLDLVIENWGRINYGKLYQFNQKKGLWQGDVSLNNNTLKNWQIYPLEFKKSWTEKLIDWQKANFQIGPALYKTILHVDDPKDTYIDMREWTKGFVIVNQFVLGRYCLLGPQQSIYLPAPVLKKGDNEILVFEHFKPAKKVKFTGQLLFEEHLE